MCRGVCVHVHIRVCGTCTQGGRWRGVRGVRGDGEGEEGGVRGEGRWRGRIYLHIQQVELDGIISVYVLVREEKLFSQSQDNCLLNSLLP